MEHLLSIGAAGWAVITFGIAIMAQSLRAMVIPDRLRRLVRYVTQAGAGYLAGVAIRLALGLTLLAAADHSRWPSAFAVIGWLTVIATFALILLGRQRENRWAEWLNGLTDATLRIGLIPALAFAVFLLLGMSPNL